MRKSKLYRAISATAFGLAYTAASQADFSYNFNEPSLSGSPTGTPLIGGSTVLGTVGQDNWVLASGVTPQVRSDAVTGFSGNYLTGTPAIPTNGQDGIYTRVGDNLGLNSTGFATFQFDGAVGPGYLNGSGNTVFKRSEMMPGVDANLDGDIRGTSLAAENGEVGFQFGYEGTGSGWYVRRAAYSNTATVTAFTTATGVYRMQLVVNFDANPVVIGGSTFNDGAGTLYVKQIADANGNPVSDVFRLADPTTANVNLALTTGMGTLGGANPANWNGLSMRTANNGALDNVQITNGVPASPPTWASNAGNWLSASNWYLTVPNAVDAEANFTIGARADSTVYADSPVTVGTLRFDNSFTYVLSGAGSLTLQKTAGSALIDVLQGTHKINLPLTIASDTSLNVAAGATLKISDPVTVNAGKSMNQTGAGAVVYESNVTLGAAASLALGSPASIHALSISGATNAWTSKVDVGNKNLVLRTGDLAQLSNQIKAGYNGGAWNGNGVTSSTAAANSAAGLGYASAASLLGLTGSGTATFDGQIVDASSLIVKYTWTGDANLDGAVTTADFTALATNFNNTGKNWQNGDFNYDGVVNALDFNAIASHFGASAPPPGPALGALVPEPGTVGFLIATMTCGLVRRRRSV